MKIENRVLISVTELDLINGIFINEEVIAIGDKCFYNMTGLKEVHLPNVIKFGDYCLSSNDKMTTLIIRYNEMKVKNVDGDCFVWQHKKRRADINIFSGYVFVNMTKGKIKSKICYVAEKGKFMAHGETIHKAIEDVNFKFIAEKLKNEPIKKDTIITINHYRLITGACEFGIKSWMQNNGITAESIIASELLPMLEKTNAYGLNNFKKLITF